MKKLIYLIASILFALTSVYGVYDIFVTKQDDLVASIMAVLFAAFLAWLFIHLFLKPEPRHKHQATNAPESSPEAASDAPTAETAPITHVNANSGVEDDYVAVDIETTGLGRDARIIELGAVRIRHGRKVASYSQLVNPQIPIPAKVTQITGITDRDVRHQPTIDKALPKFYAFCGRDTWIGHNIRRFDIPVIAREAQRVGAGMPDDGIIPGIAAAARPSSRGRPHPLLRHRQDRASSCRRRCCTDSANLRAFEADISFIKTYKGL